MGALASAATLTAWSCSCVLYFLLYVLLCFHLTELIYFSRYELQRRLDNDPQLSNISILGVDPGSMATSMARRAPLGLRLLDNYVLPVLAPLAVRLSPNGMIRTPVKSAGDIISAAFDTEKLGEYPKAVYMGGSERADTYQETQDRGKQKALWEDSWKYVHLSAEGTVLKDLSKDILHFVLGTTISIELANVHKLFIGRNQRQRYPIPNTCLSRHE